MDDRHFSFEDVGTATLEHRFSGLGVGGVPAVCASIATTNFFVVSAALAARYNLYRVIGRMILDPERQNFI